mmetsp:Transcript_31710/g.48580  ORF Transcript_31710/g.48580 Transcript_31710/m.48580 type:complete len:90 (+) Transcript_31710:667-936(+)|eukprot:CAMPEP_0170507190 /NCGR_PEP_ID=MMETSP0208-20121228/57973_1 /TAXON_ID=197538 /ORGANISM="Strombidium inclinatum, Strain S3" /LENGTH=89 /DNA_ID=CAMNT_0010789227 /DNA_START=622 /DNA_END=891 /DNA_ORIENTATION=+
MKKNEEEKLLDGIQKQNYEYFWEINQPLCDKHIADMKKYAIRVVTNIFPNISEPTLEVKQYEGIPQPAADAAPAEAKKYKKQFSAWEQV